jgi:RNA polymerase primary sigma factor
VQSDEKTADLEVLEQDDLESVKDLEKGPDLSELLAARAEEPDIDNTGAGFISREDELELIRRWQEDHDSSARAELMKIHDPFCISVAAKHVRRNPELDFDDALQQGRLGLLKAINGFDKKHGVRLTTYAELWIKHSIGWHERNEIRTVRIPRKKAALIYKLNLIFEAAQKSGEPTPTMATLQKEMGLPPEDIAFLLKARQSVLSLDVPMPSEDQGGATFLDYITDDVTPRPLDTATQTSRRRYLEVLLTYANLIESEKEIIRLRYLNEDGEVPDFKEIADRKDVTGARIRQIEIRALEKIRKCDASIRALPELARAALLQKKPLPDLMAQAQPVLALTP